MKGLIWTYLIGALFVLAILSVLSYGFGAGYVYVYWRDWQLQTTVWASIFVIAILGFVLQLLWISVKRYLSREQRKLETVFDFKTYILMNNLVSSGCLMLHKINMHLSIEFLPNLVC